MTPMKCGATVTRSVSKHRSIVLTSAGPVEGPRDVRWWCDVAHAHLTKREAVECNARTVLVNPLHATHGHGAP